MGPFATEVQAINDTYVNADLSGMKVMYMQMAGSNAIGRLARAARDADPESVFSGSYYDSYEVDFYRFTGTWTKEDFFKAWCDEYYALTGDPSLREE